MTEAVRPGDQRASLHEVWRYQHNKPSDNHNATWNEGLPKWPLKRKLSRADPCSVDVGHEAPKRWFEFCYGFSGNVFAPCFSKEKGSKIHLETWLKNPPLISADPFAWQTDVLRTIHQFPLSWILGLFWLQKRQTSRKGGQIPYCYTYMWKASWLCVCNHLVHGDWDVSCLYIAPQKHSTYI